MKKTSSPRVLRLLAAGTALFLLTALPLSTVLAAGGKTDLTGKWTSDAGGNYFLRQVANELFWYGQSDDDGAGWTNVFHGTIRGKTITGRWADVPRGGALSAGTLTLQIESAKVFRATQETGGFLSGEWTKVE